MVSNGGATGLEIDPTGLWTGAGAVGMFAYNRNSPGYQDIWISGGGSSVTSLVIKANTGNV